MRFRATVQLNGKTATGIPVPAAVVERMVGWDVVRQEATELLVPELYLRALQQAELDPVGDPALDLGELERGKPVSFTATVTVRQTAGAWLRRCPPVQSVRVVVRSPAPAAIVRLWRTAEVMPITRNSCNCWLIGPRLSTVCSNSSRMMVRKTASTPSVIALV